MSNITLGGESLTITKEQEEHIREYLLKSEEEFKEGAKYWKLYADGAIISGTFYGNGDDIDSLAIGSIFHTREEALAHKSYLLALQKIKQYIKKHDLGQKWELGAYNFCIIWDGKEFDYFCSGLKFSDLWNLKSVNACTQLIQALPEELKIVFGVK